MGWALVNLHMKGTLVYHLLELASPGRGSNVRVSKAPDVEASEIRKVKEKKTLMSTADG